jgi:hypothetical protein
MADFVAEIGSYVPDPLVVALGLFVLGGVAARLLFKAHIAHSANKSNGRRSHGQRLSAWSGRMAGAAAVHRKARTG